MQDKVKVLDQQGNEVAELDIHSGPYRFELQTVTGPKGYTLRFIYKRDGEGSPDPKRVKGAMLQ